MKKLALLAAAAILSPSAWSDPISDAEAAVRAFFATNGVNGAVEMLDPAAGVKKLLSLPAQPEAVYSAEKYQVVSYRATDAQAQPVDIDVFVNGEEGEREVSLVYVSARPVVHDMVAKGEITKVR